MNDDFQFRHQIIIAKYRQIYFLNLDKWQESLAVLNETIGNRK
jgi:hypothetical protein